MTSRLATALCALVLMLPVAATAQNAAPPVSAVEKLKAEAATVKPLAVSNLAQSFIATTADLPEIGTRTLWRDPMTRTYYTQTEYDALPAEKREKLQKRDYPGIFYYCTGYGSPMTYVRPLELLARNGWTDLKGKKILDFGYGMIGQLRMWALLGAEAHGVEVEPLFQALYKQPGDTGVITGQSGVKGSIVLHHGSWPSDPAVAREVGEGYDLILSKNTLKAGYIHPARPTDPKFLVNLGVEDETFLKAVHRSLKPGGLFLIYNIAPKQNPPDKDYLPMADGKSPFSKELYEKCGFTVLSFDETDDPELHRVFAALGYDNGKGVESLKENTFTHYTLVKRK
jgi:hypothetical protein